MKTVGLSTILLWYLRDNLKKVPDADLDRLISNFPPTCSTLEDTLYHLADKIGDPGAEPVIPCLKPGAGSWEEGEVSWDQVWVYEFGQRGTKSHEEFMTPPKPLEPIAALTNWLEKCVRNAYPEDFPQLEHYMPWLEKIGPFHIAVVKQRSKFDGDTRCYRLVDGLHRAIQACHDGISAPTAYVFTDSRAGTLDYW